MIEEKKETFTENDNDNYLEDDADYYYSKALKVNIKAGRYI
jgi:hypothetical protein